MRLQSLWKRYLSQVWLRLALGILLAATLVEASNQTTAEPEADTGELHLGVKESITLGRVLLGTMLARLLFFLVNRFLGYMDRRQHHPLRPFHWQVINRLRLSQGWARRMDPPEAEVIKTFINDIPIEGRLPVASPTSAGLLRIANLLEVCRIPYSFRMRCLRRLASLRFFQPGEPAYQPLETPAVVDIESSFRRLEILVQRDDWYQSPQAHQLAGIIANALRQKACGATLWRYADIVLGVPWRCTGSGFDLARLEPPQKYNLYRRMVRSLRTHQSTSTSLRVTFRTSTVEDRLRRCYKAMHLMRGSDPFAMPGRRVAAYWQPLELLTHNSVEPDALSSTSNTMRRGPQPTPLSSHVRTAPEAPSLRGGEVRYGLRGSASLDERWQSIDLDGLMTDDQTRVLLKGEVGSGKTTWCRRLAKIWHASDESTPAWLSSYRYLLLISLQDWSSYIAEVERESTGTRPERVVYWLTEGVWRYSLDMADAVGYRPPLGEVLLVLDGYDEVAEEAVSRDSLLGDVLHHLLQDQGAYAAPHVIITTRPQVDLGHHRDFVDQARVCRIKGLSKEHQAAFVEQYFGEHYFLPSSESSLLLLSEAFLTTLGQHSTLKQLQYNPLLLKMMCWLHFDQTHRPAHRQTLFDVSSTRLTPFYERAISALKRRRSVMSADAPVCDRLLKRLAHQRENVIRSSRVAEVFRSLEIHDQTEQRRLLSVLSVDLGLLQPLRSNPDPLNCHWEFLHKSFQEYYRALAMIDELLSDAVDTDSVFSELRRSAQQDGQLGYFLVGLLLTEPDDRAVAAAQSLINRAIDSCNEADHLKHWTWRLLGEVPTSQRSRIALPPLDVLESLDWLPRAIHATGSIELCDWLMGHVPDGDKQPWIRWTAKNSLTALHSAASCGHESLCHWLVEQVPEGERLAWIQQTSEKGWAALHLAALKGHESLCRWLLERVPEGERLAWIQATTDQEFTVLHLAAANGHESLCRWLLEQVPEEDRLVWIQASTKHGSTALHLAALNGHKSLCHWLLEQVPEGERLAWIQQADKQGWTALHLAASNGHKSLCHWLLEQVPEGERLAWIQQADKEGGTALHLAAVKGHESVCRWFAEQVPEEDRLAWIQATTKHRSTALHLAASRGHKSLCRWLVEQVSDQGARLAWIQQTSKEGWTALHIAASSGHESVCRWLVEQVPEGERLAWIQQTSKEGLTALHIAATSGHESVCLWLVEQVPEGERLAWIQQTDHDGDTALHLAALNGQKSLCRWLVEQLSDQGERLAWTQQTDKEGWTALHAAATNGHESVCRWLVEQVPEGERLATIQQTDHDGDTALHLAALNGHKSLCQWLVEQVPEGERLAWIQQTSEKGWTVLHQAAANGHESVYRWLVEQVPEGERLAWIQQTDHDGDTALHLAALNGHKSLCQWLVEQVSDQGERLAWTQQTDKEDFTALHVAATNGHESVCHWLVEQVPEGERLAWIQQTSEKGWTALHLAALNGHKSLCRWLVEQVSDQGERLAWTQQTDKEGWTALHAAATNGHESVCRWLVEQVSDEGERLAWIQQTTKPGWTALHAAATNGHESLCRWLLEQVPEGERLAWTQQTDKEGWTALHLAAANGHESVCRWLVEQVTEGERLAWILATTDQEFTVLHLAAANGHETVCRCLAEQVTEEDRLAWIQKANKEGWTALHLAAGNGHESMCSWLVDQMPEGGRLACIQQTDHDGDTALHNAAHEGHESLCRWLVEQVPQPERLGLIRQANGYGKTVLDLLPEEQAQQLLVLGSREASCARVPRSPSRPPRVQQTRGRVVGDAVAHASGSDSAGDTVGLEETKGEGMRCST